MSTYMNYNGEFENVNKDVLAVADKHYPVGGDEFPAECACGYQYEGRYNSIAVAIHIIEDYAKNPSCECDCASCHHCLTTPRY